MSSAPRSLVLSTSHLPNLPQTDQALRLLSRLSRHAEPLLAARGWRVCKLYEMCCCSPGGRNLSVAGFCVPKGDRRTAERIALRLREPKTHQLYSFDHCMRVLIHELSHIVHANHSASFYELMAQLEKDHESFLKRGVVLDEKNMPVVGGRKLDSSRHNPPAFGPGSAASQAAQERAKRQRLTGGGGRLGEAETTSGCAGSEWRRLPPGEMALRAAETRLRSWDASHGLDADELLASQAAVSEDTMESVRGGAGEVVQDSTDLQAAPHRRGWMKASQCAVCGPACADANHGTVFHPLPDEDEKGGEDRGIQLAQSESRVTAPHTTLRSATRTGDRVRLSAQGGGSGLQRCPAEAMTVASSHSQAAPRHLIVDLTLSSDDESQLASTRRPLQPHQQRQTMVATAYKKSWSCKACTLKNAALAERCTACDTWRYARPPAEELLMQSRSFSTRYFTT